MSKWIALGFGIVGLIFLVSTVFAYINTRSFIDRSVVASGTIVDVSAEWNDDHERVYYPIVDFKTAEGEMFSFKANVGSGSPGDQIGQIVSVRYDPADPENAALNSWLGLWFAVFFVAVLGLTLSALGFGGWFYLKRHPELAEREVIETEPGRFVIRFQ